MKKSNITKNPLATSETRKLNLNSFYLIMRLRVPMRILNHQKIIFANLKKRKRRRILKTISWRKTIYQIRKKRDLDKI